MAQHQCNDTVALGEMTLRLPGGPPGEALFGLLLRVDVVADSDHPRVAFFRLGYVWAITVGRIGMPTSEKLTEFRIFLEPLGVVALGQSGWPVVYGLQVATSVNEWQGDAHAVGASWLRTVPQTSVPYGE